MSSGHVVFEETTACPTTAFVYGWGSAEAHDNPTVATATAAATSAGSDMAKVDMDLRLNSYECPNSMCQTKEMRTIAVFITRTRTDFQWGRWIMSFCTQSFYRGKADYGYLGKIICK